MQLRSFLLAVISVVFVAGSASATPDDYVVNGTIPGLGSAHVVSYTILGQNAAAYAVGFDAKLGDVQGVSFCGDLLHTIGLNQTYSGAPIDLGTLAAGYTAAAKIAQRWSFDLGALGASLADAAAGTQLAIWETIYGQDFTITSALGAGAQAAYNQVLATDYSNLGVGNTVFLDVKAGSVEKQDHFFTPNTPATPEPGAALLFSAGLVIFGRALRRPAAA